MSTFPSEFVVPDGMKLRDVKARLMEQARYSEEPGHKITRAYLDTFDWLAYQAGGLVEEVNDRQSHRLIWHDLRSGGEVEEHIDQLPGFAWDLPAGPLRDKLTAVLGVRTLLPVVQVESHVSNLRLLDSEEKTVLRLLLEENRYRGREAGREGPLASRVLLVPVKGYDKPPRDLARALQALGLESVKANTNLLLEAVAAAGRRPGDYSSKLNYQLHPRTRADAATKEIMLGLLNTLEANVGGTKANLDSEFLHDLRVATRRTRSALTQIKGVFSPEVVEDYKERFAWLQQVTGPVRDLDVYLLSFDEYRNSLPEPMRPDLEPMREFLLAHYEDEQKAMARKLNSPHFRTLLKDWRNFLQAPVPEHTTVSNAVRPIKDVADERIYKMYRRVHKEGLAIGPESPPEEMHELRKSCKKLRYLMEFFQSLYPKEEIRVLIKMSKVLLDNLGNFQDLAVQAEHLRTIGQRMNEEGKVSTDALLAMGVLVGDLLKRQQQARLEFAAIFAEFDLKPNRELFRRLFAPETKKHKAA